MIDLPLPGVRRQGAADQVAEALRTRILNGDLRPGDPLQEVELAREFDLARNTVREGLRLLTRDGLATHQVHRGVTVKLFDADEIVNIFSIRTLIQADAGRRCRTLTDAERDRLRSHVDEGRRFQRAGDGRNWLTQNMLFHQATVELLGNPRLDQIFVSLLREIRLVLTAFDKPESRWDVGNAELLTLLDTGTRDQYRAAVTRYLKDSCAEVVKRMQESG